MKTLAMPIHLPEGKTCAVCLTFDFDALSVWITSFGVNTPGGISRGEFGPRVGVPRLLSLLDKYQIPTTWFVPGHTADTYPQVVKEVFRKGHEVAHHGYAHKTPNGLSIEQEKEEIVRGIHSIEVVTGKAPLGYRSPAWDFSNNTVRLLVDHGFKYDSSLMADDYTPYKCRSGDRPHIDKAFEFGNEVDLLEFPPSWSLSDWEHFEYVCLVPSIWPGLRASSTVLENWQQDFDYMYENVPGGIMVITMHPQVIGRGHRMKMLEKFIQFISLKQGACFARMIDLAQSWND